MHNSFKGAVAALALGAAALSAAPALAAPHGGGGGGHASAARAGHPSAARGPVSGAYRAGYYHGGYYPGFYHGPYFGGYWGPYWGFYGDPFFWGGLGFVAGYELAGPTYGYYDTTDVYGAPPPPAAYPTTPGGPRVAGPSGAAPVGYNCDGWRWDPAAGKYVAAKVACN
jgi:hypothetical protein